MYLILEENLEETEENFMAENDWRKQKRQHGGSIKTINGILYARIQYVDETGKRKEQLRKANNRTHAREKIRQMREELQSGLETLQADKLNFTQLAQKYKDFKVVDPKYVGDRKVSGLRSHRQAGVYVKHLIEYFGLKLVRRISIGDIQEYKDHRLKTPTKNGKTTDPITKKIIGGQRAIASVHRELALLRSIFNYAKSKNWILKSPFEQGVSVISMADEKKRERVLTLAEEKILLAVCSDARSITYKRAGKQITATSQGSSPYLKAILILALDTGMRKGEILKLRWQDVNFDLKEITILAFNTKTATRRKVGITSRVKDELEKLWNNSPNRIDDLVFGIADFKKSFATALRLASIDDLKFHDLRHTAITRLVAAGLAASEIMKTSGHTQMSTFQRYVNPNNDTRQRHANVLELYLAANQPKEADDLGSEMVN